MMDNQNSKQRGNLAEEIACHYLQQQDLKLIARNFTCKLGEIDLIMQEGEDVVFVEVRSRSQNNFGSAIESVNFTKQTKIIKTALRFLQLKKWHDVNCRFDVIGISKKNGKIEIDWIKNAFSAEHV